MAIYLRLPESIFIKPGDRYLKITEWGETVRVKQLRKKLDKHDDLFETDRYLRHR